MANGAPGKKIGDNSEKAPFIAGFPVRVAFFMAEEFKSVLPGKLFHLRHDNRVLAGAIKPGQVGIVNDTDVGCIIPKAQRLKTFHFKTIKGTVEFQIADLRIPVV